MAGTKRDEQKALEIMQTRVWQLRLAWPQVMAFALPPGPVEVGREFLKNQGISERFVDRVSERHCRLEIANGIHQVVDLNSTNGTFVNGDRATPGEPTPLRKGSILRIGQLVFVLRHSALFKPHPTIKVGDVLLEAPFGLHSTIGRVKELVLAGMADDPAPNVLITGETGTGKEALAKYVARQLKREGRPFEPINVSRSTGDDGTLLRSELFGHKKGAFSGAYKDEWGCVRKARNGTLFLDEIGALPIGMQPILLRFLQERHAQRVGDSESYTARDLLVIAATNADLVKDVELGNFREDLTQRFSGQISLLPLRERAEDIPEITRSYIAKNWGWNLSEVADAAGVEALMLSRYGHGNVRQLQRRLARARAAGGLTLHHLKQIENEDTSPESSHPASDRSVATTAPPARHIGPLDAATEARIRSLLDHGKSVASISETTGVSERRIKDIKHRMKAGNASE